MTTPLEDAGFTVCTSSSLLASPVGMTAAQAAESVLHEWRTITLPRCGARRPIRWREWLRWKLLGKVRGFDPHEELRCNHYAGHWDSGYDNHKGLDGVLWPVQDHERKPIDWSKGVAR